MCARQISSGRQMCWSFFSAGRPFLARRTCSILGRSNNTTRQRNFFEGHQLVVSACELRNVPAGVGMDLTYSLKRHERARLRRLKLTT